MELLWEEGPCTITQLTRVLEGSCGWNKSTIITMLKRLQSKQAIYYEQGGRAKLFYPAVRQEETRVQEARSLLDKAFSGNAGLMISTMLREGALSEQEIAELEHILRQNAQADDSAGGTV